MENRRVEEKEHKLTNYLYTERPSQIAIPYSDYTKETDVRLLGKQNVAV